MRIGLVWFEHGWQEAVDGLVIYNSKCQLSGLRGDQTSPTGVSLRPYVFSFVIETPAQLIHDNTKWNRIEPRNDAAVKFRRASVHRNGVKSLWVTYRLRPFFQESGEQLSIIVGCSSNDEIVGRVSPVFFEPLDVGFVSPGGHHNRAASDEFFCFSVLE